MLRSLFAGISGMRSQQTMMDVTGNNIANVNTTGFKSSQTIFRDTLSQLLRASGAPTATQGGSNPAQVGLGAQLAAITTNFGQGAAQTTGRATDLMLQGDGFFMVRRGAENLFTRAGGFTFDANGKMVSPDGSIVQGWAATNGTVNTSLAPADVTLPIGTLLPPKATGNSAIGGNLPSTAVSGDQLTSSVNVFDAQGAQHSVAFRYTKDPAVNSWTMDYAVDGGSFSGAVTTTFNASGQLTSPASPTVIPAAALPATWSGPAPINVGITGLTQYGGQNTLTVLSQDGSTMGQLNGYTISPDGTVVGMFSNGLKETLAQIAVANFNNPEGLEKAGGSTYRSTTNSGQVQLGTAGQGSRGSIASGTLEMSNVDLAQEFTNLIIAQRGFQANARVITTSDSLLQELVDLKR